MESDKPLNQSLQSDSENISSMSSNGSPRNYCGALEVNLKACAKRKKWRIYNIIGFVSVILLGILFKDKILKKIRCAEQP